MKKLVDFLHEWGHPIALVCVWLVASAYTLYVLAQSVAPNTTTLSAAPITITITMSAPVFGC